MKAYFNLQFIMLNRKMIEAGVSLFFGYGVLFLSFFGFSFLVFRYTEFAPYIYGVIGLSMIFKLSNKSRNDFLRTIFLAKTYQRLRAIENGLLAIPFVLFLLVMQSYLVAILVIIGASLLSVVKLNPINKFTISTPFSKRPFEFSIGFRKTVYLLPLLYILTYQSIHVGNFNLGVFSMLAVGFVALSFYFKPENDYFIWIFNQSPKLFLIQKIKTALLYFSFLILPTFIALVLFFPSELLVLIIALVLSYCYLMTAILAKYSAYPNEINLVQGILLITAILFPPLILGIAPIFYSQSLVKLSTILKHD